MTRPVLIFTSVLLLAVAVASAEDWLRFRGPNGSGVSTIGELPIELSPESAEWATKVMFGRSSPIVIGDTIVLTGVEGEELVTLAVDTQTGDTQWRRSVKRTRRDALSDQSGPSVASPVSDGRSVYVFFPEYGLVAYDLEGKERWRHELPPITSYYGLGASPVIEAGVLVLLCDQQRAPYMVGIDTGTGELLWRRERSVSGEGFTTPVVHHPGSDSAQIVTFGTGFVDAFAPRTGEHLWRLGGTGYAPVASPILDGDRLYVVVPNQVADYPMPTEAMLFEGDSDSDGRLSAVEMVGNEWESSFAWLDTDGDGFATKPEYAAIMALMTSEDFGILAIDLSPAEGPEILWRVTKVVPYIASPILHHGVLFLVKDGGILTSFEPKTGEVLKRSRIEGAVEPFFPSPVASNGKLYFTSNNGVVAVVSAEAQWKTLAVSDLDEEIFASPAISGGRLFIRTRENLYAFSSKAQ